MSKQAYIQRSVAHPDGMMAEIRELPALHRVLTWAALICSFALMAMCVMFIGYFVWQYGWEPAKP
jgi:hypothetical protein